MTTIESDKVAINAPASKLFSFIGDFNNLKDLMPPQVTKWESTTDTCSFNIQGMADIDLRMGEKNPYTLLKINSEGRTPFPFTMSWSFDEVADQTITSLVIDAKLNFMMATMVKGPLHNFVNILVNKLKEVAEESK